MARRDKLDSGKLEEGREGSPRHGGSPRGSTDPLGAGALLCDLAEHLPSSLVVRFPSFPAAGVTCCAPGLDKKSSRASPSSAGALPQSLADGQPRGQCKLCARMHGVS